MAIGSTIGGMVGGAIGTAIAPGIGTALGSAIGSGLGGAAGQYATSRSAFDITEAERENARRLAELRRRQELGTLGLSEREQQSLFNKQQGQIQGQLQQAQQTMRAVGAAGMMSGAGLDALRQAQLAEGGAQQMATVQRDIEARNIEEAARQKAEIEERVATASDYELRRKQAREAVLAAGLGEAEESAATEKEIGTDAIKFPAEVTQAMSTLKIPAEKQKFWGPFLASHPELIPDIMKMQPPGGGL